MFNFGRKRERDFTAELQASKADEADASIDTAVTASHFSDAEYDRIFNTLTMEDLNRMSAEELAGLAALTFAAAEDDIKIFVEGGEEPTDSAADYARAGALGNLALLKQAGISFDAQP